MVQSMLVLNLCCVCLFWYLIPDVYSAKILGVMPHETKSHYMIGNAIFKELARRGHEVTVVAWFEDKSLPSHFSYRTILLNESVHVTSAANFLAGHVSNPYKLTLMTNKMGERLVKNTLTQPQVKALLESNQSFDAVILDQFFDDGLSYLAHHFDANCILLSTTYSTPTLNSLVGNAALPSVVPENLLEYSTYMNFWQRLRSSIFNVFVQLNRQLVALPSHNRIIKELFPKAIPLNDYLYNVSLVLINAHESVTDPVVLVPNMKNIAGIHLTPIGKLPENLQRFMDEAQHGVVYFSMGSKLKIKDLPVKIRDSIFKTFSKLKVKVLLKWEDDTVPPGLPDNVKLQKWIPQQELLAHPNLRLFITHGGLLSTIEAVSHGVPILALPVFADQHSNAVVAAEKGYGISVPLAGFEGTKFEDALKKMLGDPKYKENALFRSKLFHDRPMKPLDEAVYWVEYVIRHKGAEHLRVAALKLSWYQYLLLDVAAFVIAILGLALFCLKLILRKMWPSKNIQKKLKTK